MQKIPTDYQCDGNCFMIWMQDTISTPTRKKHQRYGHNTDGHLITD